MVQCVSPPLLLEENEGERGGKNCYSILCNNDRYDCWCDGGLSEG